MAQDFERAYSAAVGTGEATLLTSNSDDALIGIRVTNILSSAVTAAVSYTHLTLPTKRIV